jgi:excisionase family DNA binding protein
MTAKRHDLANLERRLPPLTASQVARLLNMTLPTVRRWCRLGKLPYTMSPGGGYLIARSVIAKYLPDETPEEFEGERRRKRRVDEAVAAIDAL